MTHLRVFDSLLWQYHIVVAEDVAKQFIIAENKRVICTINQVSWHAALLKSAEYFYILVNSENRKKLGLKEGDQILVSLEKDLFEYGFVVPEELDVLLEQDEEANRYFMSLTVGKRRSLVYLVQTVNNSNSRLKKSLAIAHHLKDVKGKLDFKLLYETIKAFNKKSI